MSKERELLSRCLRRFNKSGYECSQLVEEIELYLAEPEKKHEPLSEEEIYAGYDYESVEHNVESWWDFTMGIRFAEKHHGVGEENKSDPDSLKLQSSCRGDKG